ncbi:unnamed protein product [Brassica rapa subsp. trilocularis]
MLVLDQDRLWLLLCPHIRYTHPMYTTCLYPTLLFTPPMSTHLD